jgi:hypothetical protein
MSTRPAQYHVPLGAALRGNEALTGLLQRLRQSQARLDAVLPLLPPPLQASVRPGPLDDTAWSLLVPNAAVAAKLRQCLPRLQEHLGAQGWPPVEIRLRIGAVR